MKGNTYMARQTKEFIDGGGTVEQQRDIILAEIVRNKVLADKLARPMSRKEDPADIEAMKMLLAVQKELRQLMEELRRLGGDPDAGGNDTWGDL